MRVFDGVQRDTLGEVNLGIQMGPAMFNTKFKALDMDTSNNLLLGRSFIHMAGVVPSTLHQLMKFVWKEQELVIHSEGSYFSGHTPIIDEVSYDYVSQGTIFYTMELVNANGDDLDPQPPMPFVYMLIATVILQNGFESGL